MEIIAICITKKPAFLHGEIRLLTTFNSSRHNHLSDFYCIASTWYNLKYFVKKYLPQVYVSKICTYYIKEYHFWSTYQILANEVLNFSFILRSDLRSEIISIFQKNHKITIFAWEENFCVTYKNLLLSFLSEFLLEFHFAVLSQFVVS